MSDGFNLSRSDLCTDGPGSTGVPRHLASMYLSMYAGGIASIHKMACKRLEVEVEIEVKILDRNHQSHGCTRIPTLTPTPTFAFQPKPKIMKYGISTGPPNPTHPPQRQDPMEEEKRRRKAKQSKAKMVSFRNSKKIGAASKDKTKKCP